MIRTLGALVGAPAKSGSAGRTNCPHVSTNIRAKARHATSTRLFRGMGRADDFRHRLGVRTDRSRRRRRRVRAPVRLQKRQGPHRLAAQTSSPPRPTSSSVHGAARNSCRPKSPHGPGFDRIPAVRDGFLREIKSPLILQPGPAALTDGLDAMVRDCRAIGADLSSKSARSRQRRPGGVSVTAQQAILDILARPAPQPILGRNTSEIDHTAHSRDPSPSSDLRADLLLVVFLIGLDVGGAAAAAHAEPGAGRGERTVRRHRVAPPRAGPAGAAAPRC